MIRTQLQSKSICRTVPYAVAVACWFLPFVADDASTFAAVTVDGNIWLSPDSNVATNAPYTGLYADDPTTSQNEGIPTNGNFVETGVPFGNQVTYEGRRFDPQVPPTPGNPNDDINVNFSILVGRTAPGYMEIAGGTGGTDLRGMDLVIGDSAMFGSVPQRGTGTVSIRGFGTLYNNNTSIQTWFPGQNPDDPMSPSKVPRPPNIGYDLYVGRGGNGALEISQGGRAEIQDAAIVGNSSGTVGLLTIDGPGSLLQSGGFQTDDEEQIHYLIVGRLGSGTMSITNGGQSYNTSRAFTGAGGGGDDFFGAVVGSFEGYDSDEAPGSGGSGTVIVDATGSRWTVGGILQLGGYHNSENNDGSDDLEGNDAVYTSTIGQGTLRITNGALVSVVPPPLPSTGVPNPPEPLNFVIGKLGRLELGTDGRFELLDVFDNSNPTNPDPPPQLEDGSVINDGVITGDGRITSLQFRNRVLGEVRVGAGEKLLFRVSGVFTPTPNLPDPAGNQEYPMSNYGLIEVLGTETQRAEIEFDRAPGSVVNPPELNRPFLNLPVTGTPGLNGRTKGEIFGQDATLRFRTGLDNHGILKFTAGTNVVSGDVLNESDGLVLISGESTSVTFEDDFTNNGLLHIASRNSPITVDGDFTLNQNAQVITSLGSPITIGGNLTFNGTSFFSLNPDSLNGLSIGDQFAMYAFNQLINPGGLVVGTSDLGNGLILIPVDPTTTPHFLKFRVCSMAGVCTIGAMAPGLNNADLDGNGIVNDNDLAIWKSRFGLSGLGDVNGDGIVNIADYTIIIDHFGQPMGAGAGAGGAVGGAVPEPGSLILLALGSVLATALCRRRQRA